MNDILYEYRTELKELVFEEVKYTDWLILLADTHEVSVDRIAFVFVTDLELLDLNKRFLNHTDFTDILTFDDSLKNLLRGDIFISVERVRENAVMYEITAQEELRRVMAHGVLHMIGYRDKKEEDIEQMRIMEDKALKMFHVEQN